MADIREQDLALKTTIADTDWIRLVTATGNHRMTVGRFKDLIGYTQAKSDISQLQTDVASVVESGSHETRGNWIKFADGTLVQYSPTITMTKVSNYYLQAPWAFPVGFLNTDYFATAISFGDAATPVGRFTVAYNTHHTATIYYQNISAPFTGTYDFKFRAFAIGRWK